LRDKKVFIIFIDLINSNKLDYKLKVGICFLNCIICRQLFSLNFEWDSLRNRGKLFTVS